MIYRVQHPGFFNDPQARQLAERACIECGINPKAGSEHLVGLCGHWNMLVLVAAEDGEPVGLLVCELPNPFMLHPVISLAYNRGSMDTGKQMFDVARQFLQETGNTRVSMLNRSRQRTDVWAHGAEIRLRAKEVARASMITLELREDGRIDEQREQSEPGLR